MHGRLKVRTTEEERERKKKEQALKVRAYNAAMSKIQIKKQNDEYDNEMLQLTLPILQRNPDVFTLWNIRRVCVQRKSTEISAAATTTRNDTIDNNDDNATKDQLKAIYETELNVTEQCLMVQPKSYAAWHHRCWTLENSPNANWQREMQLCTKYLKFDERNFHTWDYRRYVAAKAGIGKASELDFCTEKIKVNFSNYSSWHYRSQLLPALYPYEGNAMPKRPMSEEKLKEEIEMVLSAAFTDPNDSSAWFYQRWLLGYSRPALDVCAFRCDQQKIVIAFTKPVNVVSSGLKLLIFKDEVCIETVDVWHSLAKSSTAAAADTVWFAKLNLSSIFNDDKNNGCCYHIEIDIPELENKKLNLKFYKNSLYYAVPPPNANKNTYTNDVLNELQTQLDSCRSLLEFEPDSKWTLLTTALLMRAIDHNLYHEQSLAYLQKLKGVDALRQGYYDDLASKWILEKALADWLQNADALAKLDLRGLSNLNSIAYAQYFTIIDELLLSNDLELKNAHKKSNIITTFKTV